MKTTTNAVAKMSNMVIECELRSAWNQVECDLRHGVQPSRSLSDYAAALAREAAKRAGK